MNLQPPALGIQLKDLCKGAVAFYTCLDVSVSVMSFSYQESISNLDWGHGERSSINKLLAGLLITPHPGPEWENLVGLMHIWDLNCHHNCNVQNYLFRSCDGMWVIYWVGHTWKYSIHKATYRMPPPSHPSKDTKSLKAEQKPSVCTVRCVF